MLGLVLGVAFNGLVWFDRDILQSLPEDLSLYRAWRPLTSCRVFDGGDRLIDEFYVERRVWVDLDDLPPHVWQSFVVAEDRRFFEHPGFDLAGIARAVVINLQSGTSSQGASTLTQQLVKNLMVGKERSYRRKLKEAVLAYRLEQELDKRAILELYLNYIALGAGNYGVEAASQTYFGISARDLDPGQAAMLAGLVPAPSRYSPRTAPETAAQRRRLVLRGMVEEGLLTGEQAESYLDDPVMIPRETLPRAAEELAYVTQVRREVRRLFGDTAPFEDGLQVHVALDPELQAVAYRAVRQALRDHGERQGRLHSLDHTATPEAFLAKGKGLTRGEDGALAAPVVGQCFEVMVPEDRSLDRLQAGSFTFSLRAEDRGAGVASPSRGPVPLSSRAAAHDVLTACLQEDGRVRLPDRPWAEGGAVVLENDTGRVLALVGGWDVGLEGFVRATQARRQPGSSFKPYVYATALLGGHSQLDVVLDGPLSLAGGSGAWSPKNYGGGYAGPMTLRRALTTSTNTVAVRLILEAGSIQVANLAARMGVRTPIRHDPTIALGSSEVTPMDQALGYATIARGGVRTEPVYIDRLTDVHGIQSLAGDTLQVDEDQVTLPGGPGTRALPPGVSYELADMMRQVVRSGTARRAYQQGLDRAGKTGTTNDCVDAWFVGFTPAHTVAVWIGTDGVTTLGDRETGGKTALPAWVTIADALGPVQGERLPVPPEAIFVQVEGDWVALDRGTVPDRLLAPAPHRPSDPLPPFSGGPAGARW
ncbi:MAG: PBP1A family penicillin-binding protein [Deltaproteobacteria bacterium]|nr:PBP1A family penicillin-binding protein [Deltaproteobacteria bacterium]